MLSAQSNEPVSKHAALPHYIKFWFGGNVYRLSAQSNEPILKHAAMTHLSAKFDLAAMFSELPTQIKKRFWNLPILVPLVPCRLFPIHADKLDRISPKMRFDGKVASFFNNCLQKCQGQRSGTFLVSGNDFTRGKLFCSRQGWFYSRQDWFYRRQCIFSCFFINKAFKPGRKYILTWERGKDRKFSASKM